MAKDQDTKTEDQGAAPEAANFDNWIPVEEAKAMFLGNPGLYAVRVKLDDGRIGDMNRDGGFSQILTGE